jgi:TolB-like protein
MSLCSIIIPVHNRASLAHQCLTASYPLRISVSPPLVSLDTEARQQTVPNGFAAYHDIVHRLRKVADMAVQACSTVVVVSKGDDDLLRLGNHQQCLRVKIAYTRAVTLKTALPPLPL